MDEMESEKLQFSDLTQIKTDNNIQRKDVFRQSYFRPELLLKTGQPGSPCSVLLAHVAQMSG